MQGDKREQAVFGGILVLTFALFIIDLLTPRGIAISILYIGVVLLSLTMSWRHFPLLMAGICSVLNVVGGHVGPSLPGVPTWLYISNRTLVLIALWVPVMFLWQRRQAEKALRHAYEELEGRVQERTKELAEVNSALVTEITERMETERSLRASEASLEASQYDLHQSREELRALAGQLLTAQDAERRRISQELHDDINQQLAMVTVDLRAIEKDAASLPDSVRAGLGSVLERVLMLSEDIRHLAYRFYPSILDDLGLVTALQRLGDDFTARCGIKTLFLHQELPGPLPSNIASCLYRVTQEALANVTKHARASRVEIELTTENECIELIITDNGVGFALESEDKPRSGLGMVNMKERVRLVHGTCDVRSTPGDGTQVLVRIPLSVQEPWVSQKSS